MNVEPLPAKSDSGDHPSSSAKRFISLVVLSICIFLVGLLFFRVMRIFLIPLFTAALLVVVFRPAHEWIRRRCGARTRMAAGITTTLIMLVVLLPMGILITLALSEGVALVQRFSDDGLGLTLRRMRQRYDLEIPHANQLTQIETQLAELRRSAVSPTPQPKKQREMADRLHKQLKGLRKRMPAEKGGELPSAAALDPMITTVNMLQEKLAGPEFTDLGSGEDLTASEDEIHELAVQAETEIREFRTRLLGGPFSTWVKELANPSDERLNKWKTAIASRVWSMGLETGAKIGQIALGLVILLVAVYYFLADGAVIIKSFMRLSPLDDEYERQLLREFDLVSRAVVLSMLVSAVAQAAVGGIGYAIAGLESVFLLMLLTGVMSMVPFLGAASVWIVCCLYLFFIQGETGSAVFLAIYGTLIISLVDNVVKPWVLHGRKNMHPLIALLSVLGGVLAMGPIGLFIGPMVACFLHALLEMLRRELTTLENGDSAEDEKAQPGQGGKTVIVAPDGEQLDGDGTHRDDRQTDPKPASEAAT